MSVSKGCFARRTIRTARSAMSTFSSSASASAEECEKIPDFTGIDWGEDERLSRFDPACKSARLPLWQQFDGARQR